MIRFEHVSKHFGRRLVLDDLCLDVPAGEISGLLGHNGAGKSTAIGILLGHVWPDSGSAAIDGWEVRRSRRQALRHVGAIFESPAFYEDLSGQRNLEILSHYSGPTAPGRIREVLDWVGLTARAGSRVRSYSHGMRTRLALAQALLPAPRLLVLDEPGDGLDPEGIHELRGMIRQLHRELGLTVLLSSHLLNEVEQVCTRIAVLRSGRLVFNGTVAEATRHQGWVRLRTDAFDSAVSMLEARGLVSDHRNGDSIFLAAGCDVGTVVRVLVEAGRAVHEVTPQEQSLEDFYLAVMGNARGGVTPRPPVLRPADEGGKT